MSRSAGDDQGHDSSRESLAWPRIREAMVADLSAIAEVDERVFADECYGHETLRQLLDLSGNGAIVSDSGTGRLAGYAIVTRSHDPGIFWLLVLAVDPEYRHNGVGRALTQAAIRAATKSGARKLLLTVHPSNHVAIGLYARLGFMMEETHADYFGQRRPRIVMSLELS